MDGGLPIIPQVRDGISSSDDAQAAIVGGEPLEQSGEALVLEHPVHRWAGRVLQRLQAIEDEQRPLLANEPRQPLALLKRPPRTAPSPRRRRR